MNTMVLRPIGSVLSLILLLVALGGCASDPAPATVSAAGDGGVLIEVAELAAMLDKGASPVLLDVRSAAAYGAGHISGAIRVDHGQWSKTSLADESSLEDRAAWERRIGALGVDGTRPVVVSDAGGMKQAARIWFLLQHFGVKDVRVLNGGHAALLVAPELGLMNVTTAPTLPIAVSFERMDAGARVGLADRAKVRGAIESETTQIVDTRTRGEYTGADLRGNPRGGHLPSAIHLSHVDVLDASGRLKTSAELGVLFDAAGLERGRPLTTYCNSGGRAALVALAAVHAGYGPVQNYYRSFSDWSRDETCPIETLE